MGASKWNFVFENELGHMTKMASRPIYGKKFLKIISRTSEVIAMGLGM